MPKWRTAHRVADWLWRHGRLLVALALHIAATILFPVFALSLMPIATAPTLQAESYLARQAVSIETLVAAMLAYWAWLQLEAHRLVRPVLLARLRSRERRLFALALNLLFILAVATLARSGARLTPAGLAHADPRHPHPLLASQGVLRHPASRLAVAEGAP